MNEKINLQDIVNQLTEKQGMNKKDAELFVKSMFELIEEALTNEKYVKVKGLGTFKLTEVVSRESINVNTGERIEIQGHTKISFTPDTIMKELINKPFSHFETVILNDDVVLEDTITEEPEATEVQPALNIEKEENNIEEAIIPEETPSEISPEEATKEVEVIIEETVIEEVTAEEDSVVEASVAEVNETSIVVEEIPVIESLKETSTEIKEEEKPLEEAEQTVQPIHPSEEQISVTKEKKSLPILWGIIIALIIIILLGGYWLFLKPSTEEVKLTPVIPKEMVVPTEIETEEQSNDTLSTKREPETITPPSSMPTTTPLQAPINEKVPSLADTLEYRITGTKTVYTLQNGETIIKASVKFFGTKKFWPYIVKHNQDAIKDADNIPAGTQVKIPELTPKH